MKMTARRTMVAVTRLGMGEVLQIRIGPRRQRLVVLFDIRRKSRQYRTSLPQSSIFSYFQVALNFVINYEEGGEMCLLHGDSESEKLLTEIVGASAYGESRGPQIDLSTITLVCINSCES